MSRKPRDRLNDLELEMSKLNKEMTHIERDIDNRQREYEEIDRYMIEDIGKLRKKIAVFKDKQEMYEEKSKLRIRLQSLVREMNEIGIEFVCKDEIILQLIK